MPIKWTYETGRSYDSLPSGAYRVQIESAVETVSQSGNQMIKMELGVLGYRNKVKHHLTFSPKNRCMVNKALGEIYSSFDIPEGNLDAKTWVGKVGVAQLEPAPVIDRRTKDGKALWSELEQSGRIVLSSDEYLKITQMANEVRNHEIASKLISGGVAEQSVYWNQQVSSLDVSEILCKSRPDYIKPLKKGYVIVDIKTTQDASISEFPKKAYYQWLYHLQAAHYIRGFEAVTGEKVVAFMYVAS